RTIFFAAALIFLLMMSDKEMKAEVDSILHNPWKAFWIEVPKESTVGYGVYLFRKEFNLHYTPSPFIVHVSADNRYKLFVNGSLVSLGPARGDLLHWRYETVDISPYLIEGKNIIAAIVWNDGERRPEAQISYRTGFILQGNSSMEEFVDTDSSWKCVRDDGFRQMAPEVKGYYAASPGEFLDMNKHESGWSGEHYDDSSWKNAAQIFQGMPKGVFTYDPGWMLVPSEIPQMEMKQERIPKVREAAGVKVPSLFTSGNSPIVVPPNTKARILLDQTYLTVSYPTVAFSGGKGATISIKYAEALYTESREDSTLPARFYKDNRNNVSGKVFIGLEDRVVSDGGVGQTFTPLWWRAYRYIQIEVRTASDSLTIEDIYRTYTGYPFRLNAKFDCSDSSLEKILNIGWRTARLCAFETYMDCPYYEQLQYVGDTRIQALVSYYNSGDCRLARNAIDLLDGSRIADGLTQSRYPTVTTQLIPPFSLWWIGMLHDYWVYTPDSEFVRSKLPGERQVLSFFHRYQANDGSLRNTPYWVFADWVEGDGWKDGMAPVGKDGSSSIVDMQLLWAYELAGEMESRLGMKSYAEMYLSWAAQMKKTILGKYWEGGRREFADTKEKNLFSQHANALAILSGAISGKEADALAWKILADTSLTQATIYFKYYVYRALTEAGLGNGYPDWLGVWKENLRYGMTTLGEISDLKNTRSDCHAWGASPNIEFFRTVLGIDSDAPGFSVIKIEPHLGALTRASGEMPHPKGDILVSYVLVNSGWDIEIRLPEKTSGYLVWKGEKHRLIAGENHFRL
ncbi:MAG: alpha-L-rhamnosidase N-terminal domain-containing protein, partial [Bacteroidota bacterium]